jgi:hypothetical protein
MDPLPDDGNARTKQRSDSISQKSDNSQTAAEFVPQDDSLL